MESIKSLAKTYLDDTRGSHDWEHTCRVYKLCMRIGRAEGADLDVLKIAAYLHDIGRRYQDESKGAICHAKKGAEIAHSLLDPYSVPESMKANIIHCIRAHRFRDNCIPQTLEAKVLFDADKLDAIGAIGIARTFQFAGEVGARLHNAAVHPKKTKPYTENDTGYREFKIKLSKIKDNMLTLEGRRLAEARHAFMEGFFEQFLQEYEGLK